MKPRNLTVVATAYPCSWSAMAMTTVAITKMSQPMVPVAGMNVKTTMVAAVSCVLTPQLAITASVTKDLCL